MLVLTTLLYGSECWIIKAKNELRIMAAKIKLMRKLLIEKIGKQTPKYSKN